MGKKKQEVIFRRPIRDVIKEKLVLCILSFIAKLIVTVILVLLIYILFGQIGDAMAMSVANYVATSLGAPWVASLLYPVTKLSFAGSYLKVLKRGMLWVIGRKESS